MRRSLTVLAAACAALAVGACGESAEEKYKDDFPPISQKIVSLGEDAGDTIQGAGQSSDEQLADDFANYAQQLGDLQQELDELEPPGDLAEDQDKLVSAMGEVQGSLERIAQAAEKGDPDSARQATIALIQSSEDLRDARRELAGAVREL